MSEDHESGVETQDFISFGGPSNDPWQSCSTQRQRGFHGTRRAFGGRSFGRNRYWRGDHGGRPGEATSRGIHRGYQSNSGRGYTSGPRGQYGTRQQPSNVGVDDISLYCRNALEDPWAQLITRSSVPTEQTDTSVVSHQGSTTDDTPLRSSS